MFENIKYDIGVRYLDEVKYGIKVESYLSVVEKSVWRYVTAELLHPFDTLLFTGLFNDK